MKKIIQLLSLLAVVEENKDDTRKDKKKLFVHLKGDTADFTYCIFFFFLKIRGFPNPT